MKRFKRAIRCTALLCSALAVLAIGSAHAQQRISLTVVAGHPPLNAGVAGIRDVFIPEVDRRLAEKGNYRIDWTQAYAGSVADVRGVLAAVENGIADLGYVPHIFEADKLPLEQVTYMVPFGTDDPQLLMEIIDELHERIPAMRQSWERYNQRLLAPVGLDAYHLVLKAPIESLADIRRRRLGLAGLSTNWMRGSGVTPVSASLPEYYNSMQTGLLDGIVTFESAITSYKFHEVAPYIVKVNFGAMYASALTINTRVWNRLPDEVKEVIEEVAAHYRDVVGEAYRTSGERALAKAVAEGATIIEVSAEDRQAYAQRMPNIAMEWAKDLDRRGLPGSEVVKVYMDLLRERGVALARDWDREEGARR